MASVASGREGHRPAYRTVLCRYFQSGYCPAGDNCTFIHSSEDTPTPSTQQCKNFLRGSCKNGINCPFAHSAPYQQQQQQQQQAYQQHVQQAAYSQQSSASAPNEYKMDLCPHRATGACGGSPYCAWAHSVDELIPGKFSLEEIEALRRMSRNGMQQQQQPSYIMSPYGEADGYGAASYGSSASYCPPEQQHPHMDAHAAAGGYRPRAYLQPAAPAASAAAYHPVVPPYAGPPHMAYGPPAVGAFESPLTHPKAKTKNCTFWPDRCRKGDQCPYIHGDNDPLRAGGAAARMQAAAAMHAVPGTTAAVHGGVFFGGPALTQKRPRPPASVIGTKFCKFFLLGTCTRGSECTFSHDQRVREREEQQKKQKQEKQGNAEPSAKRIRTETSGAGAAAESSRDPQAEQQEQCDDQHQQEQQQEQSEQPEQEQAEQPKELDTEGGASQAAES